MLSSEKIKEIIDNNLCHRCGTCISICPSDTLGLDSNLYPEEINECTDCGLCLKVCSGIDVNFPKFYSELFENENIKKDDLIGPFKKAYVGYASDKGIRSNSSSGGIVTQILVYLFEKGLIDGALVAETDDQFPWKGRALLARTREDILSSAQSKMTVVPINSLLKRISNEEGRFALVGLPCQVHAYRKFVEAKPSWKHNQKILIIIGLFCHLNLESEAILKLIKFKGLNSGEVRRIRYRDGGWPGRIIAYCKDGSTRPLDRSSYIDTYNILSRLYYMNRCQYCIDGANEFADISIGDPWIFDIEGKWRFGHKEGWSTIIQRTSIGEKTILDAEKNGSIFIKELPINDIKIGQHSMLMGKKSRVVRRLERDKGKNRPVPNYHLIFPLGDQKERIKDSVYDLFLKLSKPKIIKDFIFFFAFSKLGDIFINIQKERKKRKKIKRMKRLYNSI